ncbi:glycosyltransferase family A protein [Sphingomonas sp.]|uniref:glycosyltransferase family 2 protein n=1 Tax=Sphingomonas sp. TaxID=28214 RepID=UPI0025F4BF48|nr:glycosyltransferase family A protein [Sphingomonas sp.]
MPGRLLSKPRFGGNEALPRLSVVMPVKNAMPFLDAAIASIIEQNFTDFELVIGDDGSTDGSTGCLRGWAARDARIRLMERTRSGGPVGSSNWVANAARSAIVARMDADDIAHPDRLGRQIELLDARPDVVLVGTLFEAIDSKGRITRRSGSRPVDGRDAPPIAHGSIMYRKAVFDAVGGYAAGTDYFEDTDLYYRIVAAGTLMVLTEPLYRYRFSETSSRLNIPVARLQHAFDVLRAKKRADRRLPPAPIPAGDLRPDTLRAVGSLRLWSGGRPGVLRDLLRSRALGWNVDAVRTVAWAVWGTISPGTLRASIRLVGRLRARTANRRAGDSRMIEWHPRHAPVPGDTGTAIRPGWSVIDGARASGGDEQAAADRIRSR